MTTTKHGSRTLGQVLTVAMTERGNTFGDVRDYILITHRKKLTAQTIANYHHDAIRTHDPVLCALIAEFYGLSVEDLPDEIQHSCRKAVGVLAGRFPELDDDVLRGRDSNP